MISTSNFFKNLLIALFIFISVLPINKSLAAKNDRKRNTFGDYAQIVNPLIAAGISGHESEKGLGHFMAIYAQSTAITHATKFVGNKFKWEVSKRPHIDNRKDRYDGMPSGQVNIAWVAAAYVRTFAQEYKYIAVPLYVTAAVTGFTKVKNKDNTVLQVVSGAAMSEVINMVNKQLKWSNEYRSVTMRLSPTGGSIGIKFKL